MSGWPRTGRKKCEGSGQPLKPGHYIGTRVCAVCGRAFLGAKVTGDTAPTHYTG